MKQIYINVLTFMIGFLTGFLSRKPQILSTQAKRRLDKTFPTFENSLKLL